MKTVMLIIHVALFSFIAQAQEKLDTLRITIRNTNTDLEWFSEFKAAFDSLEIRLTAHETFFSEQMTSYVLSETDT